MDGWLVRMNVAFIAELSLKLIHVFNIPVHTLAVCISGSKRQCIHNSASASCQNTTLWSWQCS